MRGIVAGIVGALMLAVGAGGVIDGIGWWFLLLIGSWR
jgi:hypothetical protein